ncbi:MAG: hypothetical protein K9H16_15190 [Bacteroidales bacterium]|nr:hypothetical protein [Bacteroidales bacterium]
MTNFSPEKYIRQNGRKLPIDKCLISENYENKGLTLCLIVRKQPSGYFSFAYLMIDRLCLGMKDAFVNCNVDEMVIDELIERMEENGIPEEVSATYFHNMIYGALDYAEELGLKPHSDFELASFLLNPDLVDDGIDDIEFGWRGRPLFINGPNDNIRRILSILDRNVGSGNYEHIFMNG